MRVCKFFLPLKRSENSFKLLTLKLFLLAGQCQRSSVEYLPVMEIMKYQQLISVGNYKNWNLNKEIFAKLAPADKRARLIICKK